MTATKTIFLLGPGGVGKTTISAAIGLELSRKGRTFLMTIDPAKRLKSALKIPMDDVREISKNLWATQVNKKDEFIKFARKHGIDEITQTKLFEIASDILPSEEYSAFLKIVEICDKNFDFVVVDTPPSTKFISFVDAPRKIIDMFETNSVKYFIEITGRAGARLSGPLSLAGKILGGQFVVEFAKFLGKMKKIFSEMQDVSKKAERILKGENTYLIGITSPYPKKSEELLLMVKEVEKRQMKVDGIVINRFLDFTPQGIPVNSPKGVVEFHSELTKVSERMRDEIRSIERRYPVFIVEEYFQDVVSLGVLADFSKKSKIGVMLEKFAVV